MRSCLGCCCCWRRRWRSQCGPNRHTHCTSACMNGAFFVRVAKMEALELRGRMHVRPFDSIVSDSREFGLLIALQLFDSLVLHAHVQPRIINLPECAQDACISRLDAVPLVQYKLSQERIPGKPVMYDQNGNSGAFGRKVALAIM